MNGGGASDEFFDLTRSRRRSNTARCCVSLLRGLEI